MLINELVIARFDYVFEYSACLDLYCTRKERRARNERDKNLYLQNLVDSNFVASIK